MFNFESFDIKLETEFVGRNFIYCDEIDSTNSELLANRQQYKKSGTVLLAEKQLKGKGRKDRTWQSAKGLNLTFSILLAKDIVSDLNINQLNLAASLTVALAIENLYQLRTELKWPNDVLINGKKIAGILIETTFKGSKIERVVIGFGINLNQIVFQGDFNYPPTSLKLESRVNIDRELLLAEVLNTFEELLMKLPTQPESILEDWRTKCKMIGDKITITDGDKSISGTFYDIDDNGYLLLKRNEMIEKIHFGDVSLV
jgi:BirA family transcriptional regulator, biotin operon repressor / biotin---[acetyl-CoA-carboxylase] ligase